MVSISSGRSGRVERSVTSSGGVADHDLVGRTGSRSPQSSAALDHRAPRQLEQREPARRQVLQHRPRPVRPDVAPPRGSTRSLASRAFTSARRRSSLNRAIVAATSSDTATNATSATMSSGSVDPERVHRRGEVVGEQRRARHRGGEAGRVPQHGRRRDREQQDDRREGEIGIGDGEQSRDEAHHDDGHRGPYDDRCVGDHEDALLHGAMAMSSAGASRSLPTPVLDTYPWRGARTGRRRRGRGTTWTRCASGCWAPARIAPAAVIRPARETAEAEVVAIAARDRGRADKLRGEARRAAGAR